MVSSKFNCRIPRGVSGRIAVVAVLMLLTLWFFSRFVVNPEVHAVTHAVLQAVTVPSDQKPPPDTGAGFNSILGTIASQQGEPITLPFLRTRDHRTALVKFVYSITLDEKTLGTNRALLDTDATIQEDTYGLLFTQIINGGDFYLNGNWVAGLARSNKAVSWIWYEPFVVPLPSRLLKTDGTPNVLTVSQTTQEPHISIPRLYFGHIDELTRVYSIVYFICSALADAFTVICFVAGLFLLGIWTVSPKERIYAVAGSASIVWAVMFTLFGLQESRTDLQELLRWSIYASQGGVISLMTIFILSFINRAPGWWAKLAIFSVSGVAALVYALGGSATEPYLDLLWWPAVMMLYTYAIALLTAHCWKTRKVPAGLVLLQSVLFLMLALRDYAVQQGLIDKLSNSGLETGWSGLFFEHIPALFLGMPFLLMVAGYLLTVKYRDNVTELGNSRLFLEQREVELMESHQKREVVALFEATLLERERIYQDIHDGIGSHLVKAIFNLRSSGSDPSAVVDNLQACLRDLRLVIEAQPESNVDIQTTVFAFCVTQELYLEGTSLSMSYNVGLESTIYADPKVTLNVLRVLQESLSNTLKHSGATYIDINLELRASHLLLTITDNGQGHRRSAQQVIEQQSAYGRSGNKGITGLALRAADIGASYTINMTDSGTKVRLSIPIPGEVKINDRGRGSSTIETLKKRGTLA